MLKGDSGEFEVRPDTDQTVLMHSPVNADQIEVPRVLAKRAPRPPEPDLQSLVDAWNGASEPEYGIAAIEETMALVLMLTDDLPLPAARQRARTLWQAR